MLMRCNKKATLMPPTHAMAIGGAAQGDLFYASSEGYARVAIRAQRL